MNGSTNSVNQGLCPDGWRIPNDYDWNILINVVGGMDLAGGALKDTSSSNWQLPNVGATNSSGFTAGGSGDRVNTSEYLWFKTGAVFWTASLYSGKTAAMVWSLRNSDDDGYTTNIPYDDASSLRCIKN